MPRGLFGQSLPSDMAETAERPQVRCAGELTAPVDRVRLPKLIDFVVIAFTDEYSTAKVQPHSLARARQTVTESREDLGGTL